MNVIKMYGLSEVKLQNVTNEDLRVKTSYNCLLLLYVKAQYCPFSDLHRIMGLYHTSKCMAL